MVELLERRLDLVMSAWVEEDAPFLPEIRLRKRATELGMPANLPIHQVRDFLKAYVLTNVPAYSAAIVIEDADSNLRNTLKASAGV